MEPTDNNTVPSALSLDYESGSSSPFSNRLGEHLDVVPAPLSFTTFVPNGPQSPATPTEHSALPLSAEMAIPENCEESFKSIAVPENFIFVHENIVKFQSVDDFCSKLPGLTDTESRFQIVGLVNNTKTMSAFKCLIDADCQLLRNPGFPQCTYYYDPDHRRLILSADNLSRSLKNKTDVQQLLLHLLLALSDVIVFEATEQVKDEFGDLIRMRDIMQLCKWHFSSHFEAVHPANPEYCTPALLYLQQTALESNKSLSERVQDLNSSYPLYCGKTEIASIEKNDFHKKLDDLLHCISSQQIYHSVAETFLCIENCRATMQDRIGGKYILSQVIPSGWFRCTSRCEECDCYCSKVAQHDGQHDNDEFNCKSLSDGSNKAYFCLKCRTEKVPTQILLSKPGLDSEYRLKLLVYQYIFPHIVECARHGIVHTCEEIEASKYDGVQIVFLHKWPNQLLPRDESYTLKQQLIDEFNEGVGVPVHHLTMRANDIVSDYLQPSHWQSNSSCQDCFLCHSQFNENMSKHHCRRCGFVFCTRCRTQTYQTSQFLCKTCVESEDARSLQPDSMALQIRKCVSGIVSTPYQFAKDLAKSHARPVYWQPDETADRCAVCQSVFDREMKLIHHCRCCGLCVCGDCSKNMYPVPRRQITSRVRVCDKCVQTKIGDELN